MSDRDRPSRDLRLRVIARDASTCAYCGTAGLTKPTVDHLDPRAGHAPDNLVCACHDCNDAKGPRLWWEYAYDLFVCSELTVREYRVILARVRDFRRRTLPPREIVYDGHERETARACG